jgi:hypothetical protein
MEVEVGPQMQGDEATGESRPGEGGHDGVRGVHDDVHDDVHACVGACEPLRRHASQPSGRLHHPVESIHCLCLWFPGVSPRHTRRNEGDHLATRDHGRDERAVRTLPLNELPYQ